MNENQIFTAHFGDVPLRFVYLADRQALFVSRGDVQAAIEACWASQLPFADFLDGSISFFADSSEKASAVLDVNTIGAVINVKSAGSLMRTLGELTDVESDDLRESAFRISTLHKWYIRASVSAINFFELDIQQVMQMTVDHLDKHNPALVVRVVEDNGIWIGECEQIGLITEADNRDALEERVWEIAPELAKLSGLETDADSIRIYFKFDEDTNCSYDIEIESYLNIAFDPHKDKLNLLNHGISLEEANQIEWETFISEEDDRFAYGEMRMIGHGYIGRVLYRLTYVEYDDENWRAISLRPANKREIREYAET